MNNVLIMLDGQNIAQPSIVLMDGNLISYEKDASETGETNRLVIRQQLAGRLGDPMPIFSEIGTNVGWNRWQDIIIHKPEPDIVIVHWSSFEKDGFDPNKDVLSCHPASGNRCADRIMNGLRLIIKSKSGSKSPRIIIYSRARGVCSEEFRNLLRQRIPKDEKYMNQHFSLLLIFA